MTGVVLHDRESSSTADPKSTVKPVKEGLQISLASTYAETPTSVKYSTMETPRFACCTPLFTGIINTVGPDSFKHVTGSVSFRSKKEDDGDNNDDDLHSDDEGENSDAESLNSNDNALVHNTNSSSPESRSLLFPNAVPKITKVGPVPAPDHIEQGQLYPKPGSTFNFRIPSGSVLGGREGLSLHVNFVPKNHPLRLGVPNPNTKGKSVNDGNRRRSSYLMSPCSSRFGTGLGGVGGGGVMAPTPNGAGRRRSLTGQPELKEPQHPSVIMSKCIRLGETNNNNTSGKLDMADNLNHLKQQGTIIQATIAANTNMLSNQNIASSLNDSSKRLLELKDAPQFVSVMHMLEMAKVRQNQVAVEKHNEDVRNEMVGKMTVGVLPTVKGIQWVRRLETGLFEVDVK